MSIFSRFKKLFLKKQSGSKRHSIFRIVGLSLLAVGNVTTISIATFAWFGISNRESQIEMVSGDLDVDIESVTAYKYVYPYYKNSAEFINYDTDGEVKRYVIEDHKSLFDGNKFDEIPIRSDNATVTLSRNASPGTTTTDANNASSTNICIPSVQQPALYKPDFRYYLIGDNLFCGVDDSWRIEDAGIFPLKTSIGEQETVIDNVVVSAGSSFALLECITVSSTNYYYFTFSSIAESASPFRIIDGNRILCIRSGIYKFTYSADQLEIELRTKQNGTKKDISVISNNSMDPTMITIEYAGSVNKTDPEAPDYFERIEDYMATAIYNQNTTLILDVELAFKNANPVDASLEIERKQDNPAGAIFNLNDKYQDTSHYLSDAELRASDFYNFYAVFTKTPYTDVNDDDGDEADDLWLNLHRIGDSNSSKFSNEEEDEETHNPRFDDKLTCQLNTKELDDSITVPGVDPEGLSPRSIYHCYIAIEYDYEHCLFFINKNRLGKTYPLDRDFSFHFFGVQHTEQ